MVARQEMCTHRQRIMTSVLLVTANSRDPIPERIAPILSVPIRPTTEVMGEADRAPVIDPRVKIAAIRPNLDDYFISIVHQTPALE